MPDLVGLLTVRIRNSTSIISGVGVLEVYNAAGELYILNPERFVSDDLLYINLYRRKRLKGKRVRTNNENKTYR